MEPWTAFWIAVACFAVSFMVIGVMMAIPAMIKAHHEKIRFLAEAGCEHEWELERMGDILDDMGTHRERKIGTYSLYRCNRCGASRQY